MQGAVEIGRVAEIHRYPVKSMRGQSLQESELRWNGLAGDRQFAFYRTADTSSFPWLTGREAPQMVLWWALYDDSNIKTSSVHVTTDDGTVFDVRAPELATHLSNAAGEDVALIRMGRGAFDSMPISVVGMDTIEAIGGVHGAPVDVGRFRSNIVIDRGLEKDWLGGRLIFGDPEKGVTLRADRPIARCALITVDPETAQRDASVLRTVAQHFENEVGVYCTLEVTGQIAVGMNVWLSR
jgi:uncharacterized protein YcbX